VAIRTLVSRGTSNSVIARLLDVTEGAVRYHVACVDGPWSARVFCLIWLTDECGHVFGL
jgi:predicted transcriptional regulator